MPKIPVYEAQVSTGGVPQTPRATADDFGAMTSAAIVDATQAGLDLAGTVVKVRHAAETNRGEAEAMQRVNAAVEEADKDEDPATVTARFGQRYDALRGEYARMGDGAFRNGALRALNQLGPTLGLRVRTNAAKREAALHRRDLDADADLYIGGAAAASNDLERQSYVNLAKTAIARAHEAGYIGREDALARLGVLSGQIDEKRVAGLIERDPAAALKALDDPKQYTDLPPTVRELMRGRAMLGRQKASFATVSAVRSGFADGTKTAEDVDALLKDGAIGEATHGWLKKQAEKAGKERAEKAAGRERVQRVLDEGGKLDPKKAGDRAANDAYYDEVVAPGKPDAAALVAYVAKTGMVPETLGRRVRGGLASDDPQQAVNAASLLVELGKQDGKLTEGFGAKRLRFVQRRSRWSALRTLAPAGPSRFSRH
jgi:hypothetical protein